MRKIVMFNFITVDGYFSGDKDDLSWHPADAEFDNFAAELIQRFDTVLFGRVTYELFAGFWPAAVDDQSLTQANRDIAQALNSMRKIVFSDSDLQPNWEGTEVHNSIDPQAIRTLKEQDGNDIVVYGSGTIVRQLTNLGLIDEYQMITVPLILGKGKLLFEGVQQTRLTHVDMKMFNSGSVLQIYTLT